MLKTNVGTVDRILRVVLGLALLVAFFQTSGGWGWLYLIGLVPLVTGLIGSCPVYSLLGVSTCRIGRT